MDFLFQQYLSWGSFIGYTLLLFGFYFALVFLQQQIPLLAIAPKKAKSLGNIVHQILSVYEPFLGLFWGSLFALLYPALYGSILLVLIIITFPYLRSYATGLFLRFDQSLQIGDQMRIQAWEGTVMKINRWGVSLQYENGLQYINWYTIYQQGFCLQEPASAQAIQINLQSTDKTDKLSKQYLQEKICQLPYILPSFRPQINFNHLSEAPTTIQINLKLKDPQYKQPLQLALKDWGYEIK